MAENDYSFSGFFIYDQNACSSYQAVAKLPNRHGKDF